MFGIDPKEYWLDVDDVSIAGGIIVIYRGICENENGRIATCDILSAGPNSFTRQRIRWLLEYSREVLELDYLVAWIDNNNISSFKVCNWMGFKSINEFEDNLECYILDLNKCPLLQSR